MGETESSTERKKSREVRLGLVMYGGVSLAIYINGIAHELFRAVRGRGTYRLLKALTDSDITVDVLSGASAGGINGVLLAYALCNECEFKSTAALWRQHGDIGQLLRDTDQPSHTYQSLFDSEHKYERWLQEAFDTLAKNPISTEERKREEPTPVDELDLFVTGTDFYGRKWSTVDDRGSVLQVKEHRAVFLLKHRARLERSATAGPSSTTESSAPRPPKWAKLPFSPNADAMDRPGAEKSHTHAALARLCRITSCFPAAFEPVTVGTTEPADLRLRRWGGLDGSGERVYIDGGVLDNKPFSTTLEAIYSRLANRPVKRWLFYVEPDPEQFAPDPADLETPNVVQTIVASLTSIPGYESIADDLRSLKKHNERVERIAQRRDRARHAGPSTCDEAEYRRLRLIGLAKHIFRPLFRQEVSGELADPQRLEAQRVLRKWFEDDVLKRDAESWSRYHPLDVDFRLRRLLHLTYCTEGDSDKPLLRGDLLAVVNRQIEALEIVRHGMEAAVEAAVALWLVPESSGKVDIGEAGGIWSDILHYTYVFLEVAPPPSYAATSVSDNALDHLLGRGELAEFAQRVNGLASRPAIRGNLRHGIHGLDSSPAAQDNVLRKSDDFERAILRSSPHVLEEYERFDDVDRVIFPLEHIADLRSHDVIDLARISPRDAQLGLAQRPMEKKVIGQRLWHFAAFFKRSWRSNDILWGRLDGACKLVDVLLDADRIAAVLSSNEKAVEELRRTVKELEQDSASLRLPASEREQLFEWLRDLLDPGTRAAAIAELEHGDGTKGPRLWLVEAAQLEALPHELQDVYCDAFGEQLEWNQFRGEEKGPFVPGKGWLDPGVIAAAAADLSTRRSIDLGENPEKLREFFEKHYRIGEEQLRDIPPIVVLDWVARGLIVAQKSLLLSLEERADLVQSHPIYQIFLGWPLRAFAGIVGALRRSPRWLGAATLGAIVYIALSIFILFEWHDVVWDEGEANTLGGALFLAIPLFLVLFLRVTAAARDGSGWPTWAARCLGWGAALFLVLVSAPVVGRLSPQDPRELCTAPPLTLLPTSWAALWSSLCTPRAEGFAMLGRLVVVTAIVFGVLAVSGGFGVATRHIRSRWRSWSDRRRRQGQRHGPVK